MRKIKRTSAALLALMLAFAMAGCDTGDDKSSFNSMDQEKVDQIKDIAKAEGSPLTGELENKKVIWMANWDINPDASGKEEPLELVLFKEIYGGEVEYRKVAWENRYQDLAQAIIGGDGIDFFPAGDMDAFPKGAIRDMFAPVDDYIDFDSEVWKDVKELNDQFLWNGNHYVIANAATGDNCVVIYNRDTINEYGLDDPAELYEKGEWDWNAFKRLLSDFCDIDENRHGIDGYWTESALSKTTGVAYVGLENGKLVNNLQNKSLERVQNFMYDLNKSGYVLDKSQFSWSEQPAFLGEGKELFYPCGAWGLYKEKEQWGKTFGEDAFFVPMPKDPEADAYYVPAGLDGYMLCRGAQNPEGVAAFASCKRFTIINKDLSDIGSKQLLEVYGWTQEMVDMLDECHRLAEENPVYDFYTGVSQDVATILDSGENGIRGSLALGLNWNELVSAAYDTIDILLSEANDAPVQGGSSFD